ncbi:membrane protein BRI3-like [Plodia interpunctella]|uniref:membrane protein BRI3-like n=1 Tax=Plodia interpunctella TaxID=58824 RepID=UPI002367F43B|nr:brain protein I3-like [Plodia interpunctella]
MEKPAVTDQPPPYSAVNPGPPPNMGNAPPPPPPGYPTYGPPPPPPGYMPNYGATSIIIQPPIIAVGACPACRVGILEDDFTCLGILCAIFFFPIGILCCLALKNRRCSNCGAMFG